MYVIYFNRNSSYYYRSTLFWKCRITLNSFYSNTCVVTTWNIINNDIFQINTFMNMSGSPGFKPFQTMLNIIEVSYPPAGSGTCIVIVHPYFRLTYVSPIGLCMYWTPIVHFILCPIFQNMHACFKPMYLK